ncbi:ANTAR domain-containing protein [Pseudofrankia sp. DC12]|uniref:ANTAR domain-containing protein n=1 Tax=Pseudofrankia sp. DC12 TaxID=683315 RepID=UPI000A048601|nr:ANTAR domain-containing protein [Pseudofrankia sp. DC12]
MEATAFVEISTTTATYLQVAGTLPGLEPGTQVPRAASLVARVLDGAPAIGTGAAEASLVDTDEHERLGVRSHVVVPVLTDAGELAGLLVGLDRGGVDIAPTALPLLRGIADGLGAAWPAGAVRQPANAGPEAAGPEPVGPEASAGQGPGPAPAQPGLALPATTPQAAPTPPASTGSMPMPPTSTTPAPPPGPGRETPIPTPPGAAASPPPPGAAGSPPPPGAAGSPMPFGAGRAPRPGPPPRPGPRPSPPARAAVARPAQPPSAPPAAMPEPGAELRLRRTSAGWVVEGPGTDVRPVGDLISAMVLADLLAEDLNPPGRPRRADRELGEIEKLRLSVVQLEHALASRVIVEQAIGVLAERHHIKPRDAFERLRRTARGMGRRVHDLARQVVESVSDPRVTLPGELGGRPGPGAAGGPGPGGPTPRPTPPRPAPSRH